MSQTARELFQQFSIKKDVPNLRGVRGTYLFDIEQVGSWFVSVNDGAITVEETRRDADCTVICDEPDFLDIIEGRRNLVTAVMQGRVKVRGDIVLAQKFHRLVSARIESERGAA